MTWLEVETLALAVVLVACIVGFQNSLSFEVSAVLWALAILAGVLVYVHLFLHHLGLVP